MAGRCFAAISSYQTLSSSFSQKIEIKCKVNYIKNEISLKLAKLKMKFDPKYLPIKNFDANLELFGNKNFVHLAESVACE